MVGEDLRCFTIYFPHGMMFPQMINRMKRSRELLQQLGAKNVREQTVTYDYDLQGRIERESGSKTYPIIYCYNQPIGDVAKLEHWVQGELKEKQQAVPFHIEEKMDIPQQVRVIPSPILSREEPKSFPAIVQGPPVDSDDDEDEQIPNENNNNAADDLLDDFEIIANNDEPEFRVIQINWYWRHQDRILRFFKEEFTRIEPKTHTIRETHQYKDISQVVVMNRECLNIWFHSDKTQTPVVEYYQTSKAADIVDLLISKNNRIKVEFFES